MSDPPVTKPGEPAPNTTDDGAWTCPRCPWSGLHAPARFDTDRPMAVECPECSKTLSVLPTVEQLQDEDDA